MNDFSGSVIGPKSPFYVRVLNNYTLALKSLHSNMCLGSDVGLNVILRLTADLPTEKLLVFGVRSCRPPD